MSASTGESLRRAVHGMVAVVLLGAATTVFANNDCKFSGTNCTSVGGKCTGTKGTCTKQTQINTRGDKIDVCVCLCEDPTIHASFVQNPPASIGSLPTTRNFVPSGTWVITGVVPGDPDAQVTVNPTGTMRVRFEQGEPGAIRAVIEDLHLTVPGLPDGTDTIVLFTPVDPFIAVDDMGTSGSSAIIIDQSSGELIGAVGLLSMSPEGPFPFTGSMAGVINLGNGAFSSTIGGRECPLTVPPTPLATPWGQGIAVVLLMLAAAAAIYRLHRRIGMASRSRAT